MSQEKNLYPITRKEKILDGQDLAPVTRLEYFLKKAATKGEGGGGGGIQIIRPLKIKDLPPVPQDLTPDPVYNMTDPEAYAPCLFSGQSKPSTIVVVEESAKNIRFVPSYLEIAEDDVLYCAPVSLHTEAPHVSPAIDSDSNMCAITAEPLPIGVGEDGETIPIDIATIKWVRIGK